MTIRTYTVPHRYEDGEFLRRKVKIVTEDLQGDFYEHHGFSWEDFQSDCYECFSCERRGLLVDENNNELEMPCDNPQNIFGIEKLPEVPKNYLTVFPYKDKIQFDTLEDAIDFISMI